MFFIPKSFLGIPKVHEKNEIYENQLYTIIFVLFVFFEFFGIHNIVFFVFFGIYKKIRDPKKYFRVFGIPKKNKENV